MAEGDIVDAVDADLRRTLLSPDAGPPKVLGVKVWPAAIPQYELSHLDLMDELGGLEDANGGGGVCGCAAARASAESEEETVPTPLPFFASR